MFLRRLIQSNAAREKGSVSERLVSDYIQLQGLQVLATNYYCRQGEIDIIALDNDQLVFIEVKSRSGESVMPIRSTLSKTKQKKIIRTAQHFLTKHAQYTHHQMRFDFVGVNTQTGNIDWLRDAFGLSSY